MVNQESGGAALNGKKVIPVVWGDMDPAKLPGWLREYQALDLRGQDARQIQTRVEIFVQQLVREQQWEVIAVVALLGWAAIAIFAK